MIATGRGNMTGSCRLSMNKEGSQTRASLWPVRFANRKCQWIWSSSVGIKMGARKLQFFAGIDEQ